MNAKQIIKKENSSSYIPLFTLLIVFLSIAFCLFAFQFPFANIPHAIFAISMSIVIFSSIVGTGILYWFLSKKYFGPNSADIFLIVLISLYVLSSCIFAVCFSKFSSAVIDFEKINNIIQVAWTIFGVSVAFYAIIVGLPNLLSSKKTNFEQSFSVNILDTMNPIIYSVATLIIATFSLYCFYENNPNNASNMAYASLIVNALSVPYYLIVGLYLLYKTNKQKIK